MLCVPRLKASVAKTATPLLSVPVPSTLVPSLKVTVPVGVPTSEVTRAVKVTRSPTAEGLLDELG